MLLRLLPSECPEFLRTKYEEDEQSRLQGFSESGANLLVEQLAKLQKERS